MVYRVDVSYPALADIDSALSWIRRRSDKAAESWLRALVKAIGSLERMPNRCPIAPETRSFVIEIRYLIFSGGAVQQRVIFGVSVDENSGKGIVTIYRVRNSRQLPLSDADIFGEYHEKDS